MLLRPGKIESWSDEPARNTELSVFVFDRVNKGVHFITKRHAASMYNKYVHGTKQFCW